MNTHVDFSTAKLLKEKGFDLYCVWSYWNSELTSRTPGYALEVGTTSQENYWDFDRYYAPTIAEVVMWLYEKHDVWIYVDSHEFSKWCYNYKFNRPHKLNVKLTENGQFGLDDYNSPTDAYEGAIEYTLNKLI